MRDSILVLCGAAEIFVAPLFAHDKPNMEGEQTLAGFARCVVRDAPREASSFITTVPNSAGESEHFEQLLKRHGACLELPPSMLDQQTAAQLRLGQISVDQALRQVSNERRQIAFSRQAFRGAIAERLYLDNSKIGSFVQPAGPENDRETGVPLGYLVVSCAAARDPIAADKLVRAKRLSSREAEAANALGPALQDCARGKGRVDLSGTAIHGWMAEALYKQRGANVAGAH